MMMMGGGGDFGGEYKGGDEYKEAQVSRRPTTHPSGTPSVAFRLRPHLETQAPSKYSITYSRVKVWQRN